MEFEPKFDNLFPVDDKSKPVQDAGFKPLENETKAFEAFEVEVQARTSASAENYSPIDLISHGLDVLNDSSRDLKVFVTVADVALSPPLGLQGPEIDSLISALGRALGPYWSIIHPQIDSKRGVRARQMLVQEAFNSLERHLEAANTQLILEFGPKISGTLAGISKDLANKGEPWSDASAQVLKLSKALEAPNEEQAKPDPVKPPLVASTKPTKSNPREMKNRLLALVDELTPISEELESPIGLALRRKAAFLPFEGEVTANQGHTELKDIPEERIQEIRAALEAPTLEAFTALEQTLLARPLWLTGHRYAHDMALKLGGELQADAIWNATCHEVGKFDRGLLTLHFVDGLAFSDPQTTDWLTHKPDPKIQGQPSKDGSEEPSDALDLLESEISSSMVAQPNLRHDLITLVSVARTLSERSNPKLAAALARNAKASLEIRNLQEWENDLLSSLRGLLSG